MFWLELEYPRNMFSFISSRRHLNDHCVNTVLAFNCSCSVIFAQLYNSDYFFETDQKNLMKVSDDELFPLLENTGFQNLTLLLLNTGFSVVNIETVLQAQSHLTFFTPIWRFLPFASLPATNCTSSGGFCFLLCGRNPFNDVPCAMPIRCRRFRWPARTKRFFSLKHDSVSFLTIP